MLVQASEVLQSLMEELPTSMHEAVQWSGTESALQTHDAMGDQQPASSSAAPRQADHNGRGSARKDTENVPQPLSPDLQEMVSKRLSVVLRHDKGEFNLRFDERALVPLEDVLQLPIMRSKRIDRKHIMSAIYHNDKKRLRGARDEKMFIGASQGHSFKINPDCVHTRTPTEKMPVLVHGTHYDFLQSILQHGIRPGGLREGHRQMVHCLKDDPSAAKFYPPGVDVMLHISPQKTDATWYRSENGYYMTSETVPAKAIDKVSVVGSSDVVYAEGDQAVLRVQSKGSRHSAPARSSASRAYMSAFNASGCRRNATPAGQVVQPIHVRSNMTRQDSDFLEHITGRAPRGPLHERHRQLPHYVRRNCLTSHCGSKSFTRTQNCLMFCSLLCLHLWIGMVRVKANRYICV